MHTNLTLAILSFKFFFSSENNIACSLYSTEGTSKGDWYIPAKHELIDMKWATNKLIIQNSLNSLGSKALSVFESDWSKYFWSSTEYDSYSSYYLKTETGNVSTTIKSNSGIVRAFYEILYVY